jgi:hypothetical protein
MVARNDVEEGIVTLHDLFNRHVPDLKHSRWDSARFVTECLVCKREMVKRAESDWEIVRK